ncbi:MAG TPA: hypothetical protein VNT54_16285, partial [Solirubrobacteraceae bacterium]|nr:hypothetical protein [Solirubrobacteraceae bacterium]
MAARRSAALDRRAPVAEALNAGTIRPEPPPLPPDGAVATAIREGLPTSAAGPVQVPGTGIALDAALAGALAGSGGPDADAAVDVGAVRARPLPASFEPVRELAVLGSVAAGVANATGVVAEHGGRAVLIDAATRVTRATAETVVVGGVLTLPGTAVGGVGTLARAAERAGPGGPRGPGGIGPIGPIGPADPGAPRAPIDVRRVREIDRATLDRLLGAATTRPVLAPAGERPALDARPPGFLERFVIPHIDVGLPGGAPSATAPPDPGAPERLQVALVAHLAATVELPDGETVRRPADLDALARTLARATDPTVWSAARARAAIATGAEIADD